MYKTEYEIFNQYISLEKTYEYLVSRTDDISCFKNNNNFDSVTFIGCGSSYSLCKSAELSLKLRTSLKVNSIAAGDLMTNLTQYNKLLENTLLVAPSRSGSTSEVVNAVTMSKEKYGVPCISICAVNNSELAKISDLCIELPWAFDESVCQTRTVTNLYTANLYMVGVLSSDELLCKEIKQAIDNGDKYIKQYKEQLKIVAKEKAWENVVTLGDSELEGIAEEGALAFKEICQLHSNYYHILDVRHGPAVLINDKTLIIIAVTPFNENYQIDLIKDLKKNGATIVTVGSNPKNVYDSDYHISVPLYKNYSVMGIPFIFIPQALSYFKALERGVNPDVPNGLDPWIKL